MQNLINRQWQWKHTALLFLHKLLNLLNLLLCWYVIHLKLGLRLLKCFFNFILDFNMFFSFFLIKFKFEHYILYINI